MSGNKKPVSAKRRAAQKEAAHKRPQTWKPGQSGNPKGRPSLGISYKEIFTATGNLTIGELKERYAVYAERFPGVPDDIHLKDLVALSVLVGLAIEPTPGLLATLLDRTDGPLEHTINVNRMSDEEIANAIGPVLKRLGIWLESPDATGMESNPCACTDVADPMAQPRDGETLQTAP
jgi:hypothetical protein